MSASTRRLSALPPEWSLTRHLWLCGVEGHRRTWLVRLLMQMAGDRCKLVTAPSLVAMNHLFGHDDGTEYVILDDIEVPTMAKLLAGYTNGPIMAATGGRSRRVDWKDVQKVLILLSDERPALTPAQLKALDMQVIEAHSAP